jgi:transposase-like protein
VHLNCIFQAGSLAGVAELGYDRLRVRLPKNNTSKNIKLMQCPECQSSYVNKNGHKKGKQNYICVNCARQFIDCYQPHKGYSCEVKRECLRMYVNGLGFRAIERMKGVHHTTIINWVKQVGELLPDTYEAETIPEVAELDELETFLGQKK